MLLGETLATEMLVPMRPLPEKAPQVRLSLLQ